MDGISSSKLNKSVQFIKGVGKAKAMLLQRLGIYTIGDAITHYPRDYEDRSRLKKIYELEGGDQCSFAGIIASKVMEYRPRKGLLLSRVSIRDGTGSINALWFNQPYLKKNFKIGDKYMFFGAIKKNKYLEAVNPVYEPLPIDTSDSYSIPDYPEYSRTVPIYPATNGLTQNAIRSIIENSLDYVGDSLEEVLPDWILDKYQLADKKYSINNIHFPESAESYIKARERLVFEELLLLQLGLMSFKSSLNANIKGIAFDKCDEVREFMKSLSFNLTSAQLRVFSEIENDMESNKVMNRLIQGDVGSGKTIVAVLALVKAVKSGYQGALMAPTSILAQQHFRSIEPLLKPFGIKVALLTGNTSAKDANEILAMLKEGSTDIVVGTHALLEDKVLFKNLGLVVTDEQHRFGVRQRALLSAKGENADILVMTATPIPRTLALILYGDLDISIIDELPPGRQKIKTYSVGSSMRERINKFIRKQVAEGHQVYIVCPLVEESDEVEAKAAIELANRLSKETFCDLKVSLVHGKMKPSEKNLSMSDFVDGKTDIIVSTTVIEVGVDVPNATLMVVENAERFGLAQLHQLRGRVGRGKSQSYCILFNESKSDISRERMSIMEKTADGFIIAEKDLELRGPGDFFGTRQHGIPELKIANLYRDMEILKKVQEAAAEIKNNDSMLNSPVNRLLAIAVKEKFAGTARALSMN